MRLAWQAGIFVLIVAGLANLFGGLAESFNGGTFGFSTSDVAGSRDHLRVLAVTPGSPAALAGIRAGDAIDFVPTPSNIEAIANTAAGDRLIVNGWLAGTLIVGLSGVVAIFACALAGVNVNVQSIQCLAFTMLVIPFGLAYVILRHRMLDIAFVVNRAVVYTSVSVVVVGTFIVFEWILGHFVEQNSRTSSLLQLGGALVLGFSVRFIHNRVDQYVDDVFFRERHLAEAAVRRFAHEALLITAPEDLVTKTTDVAQGNMRLSACAFFARRDGAFAPLRSTFAHTPPSVSENDYAVLGMRTWHTPVTLHETQTGLPGELALPMIVRGELAGFLLCGDKRNHEAFAPDERDALAQLARDAGIALDSLRVREIERELAQLERLAPRGATGGDAAAL